MPTARLGARSLVSAPLLIVFATGCCSTFERDWRNAQCAVFPQDELAGVWEGTWESEHNGHHGALRAIITKCGENQYTARYHATFCAFLPYAYETCHVGIDVGGARQFQGQTDLGWLAGGDYLYHGWANGAIYEARYQTENDHGVFRMCRRGAVLMPPASLLSPELADPPAEAAPPPVEAPHPVESPRPLPATPEPTPVSKTVDPFDDSVPLPPPSPR